MFHLGPGVLPRKLLRIQAWGHWAPKLPQGTAAWCWGSCSPALPSLAPLLASVTLLVTGSLPLRLVRRLSAMRKNSREAGGDDGPEPQPWGQTSQWGYWSLPGCVTLEVFEPPPFAHRLKEKLTQHPSHGLAVQVATTCVKPAAPCHSVNEHVAGSGGLCASAVAGAAWHRCVLVFNVSLHVPVSSSNTEAASV